MKERMLLKESFENGLDHAWFWVREAADAWNVRDSRLRIQALPGTLWGQRNDARNLLLRPAQPATRGMTSEVWVRNQPAQQGEQAGLIWYVDDGTYVKLIKECLDGEVWIVMAREEDDQPALVNRVPVSTDAAAIRLVQGADAIVGQFRAAEGDAWQTVGRCASLPIAEIHPGLFAHGGPADDARWAEFQRYHIYLTDDAPE
jgi:regulation of enolase protein 1 (concanavalin A-like superfamily)